MSRKASALRARKSAPGMLRVENTSDVFQGFRPDPWVCGASLPRAPEKKSREVLAVVLDASLQDMSAVDFRRQLGGDRRPTGRPFLHHHLDAASRVIERFALDVLVASKEVLALIERHIFGIHLSDLTKRNTGRSDQVVYYAHAGFSGDDEIVLEQKIVILMHGAVQRILKGNRGGAHAALFECRISLVEALEGNRLSLGSQ